LPGPPISFGTERSALTEPSLASVWPLRPPVAVAIAVKSGLILSMSLFSLAWIVAAFVTPAPVP